MRRTSSLILVAIALIACTGCHKDQPGKGVNFYLSSPQELWNIQSVVLLEIPQDDAYPHLAADTTAELFAAIAQRRIFSLEVLKQRDPLAVKMPDPPCSPLSLEQIALMRRELNCDGAMLAEITMFEPYPRMRLGLNVRLVDLRTGHVVWAVDNIWDSTQADLQHRLRRYYLCRTRESSDPLGWRLALTSPRAFQKFVAYEVALTLPERELPKPPEKAENDR